MAPTFTLETRGPDTYIVSDRPAPCSPSGGLAERSWNTGDTKISRKAAAVRKYRWHCTKWAAYGTFARVLYLRSSARCSP